MRLNFNKRGRIFPFHSRLYFQTRRCTENFRFLWTVTGVLHYFCRSACAVPTWVTVHKTRPGDTLFLPFYVWRENVTQKIQGWCHIIILLGDWWKKLRYSGLLGGDFFYLQKNIISTALLLIGDNTNIGYCFTTQGKPQYYLITHLSRRLRRKTRPRWR